MFTLRQTETGWEVVDGDGEILSAFEGADDDDGAQRRAYTLAVAWLADNAPPVAPAPVVEPVEGGSGPVEPPAGALSDRWVAAAAGIVSAAPTGDGRDFTGCSFTWRATTAPLPLMLLTQTEMGHYGAEVAGWIDTTGDPTAAGAVGGWFHDTDAGRQARDILAAQGSYSVSVDPGEVSATFTCTEEEADDWGSWCIDGMLVFDAYEIAGLTMVPFPAFGTAAIELAAAEPAPSTMPVEIPPGSPIAEGDVAPVAAGLHPDVAVHVAPSRKGVDVADPGFDVSPALVAAPPVRPLDAWFDMTEDDADGELVAQRDGQAGVPLTITDDGHVYGHLALWETCHVGIQGECVAPPASHGAYPHFHLGVTRTSTGRDVATGTLVAGADHAALRLRAPEATDWYAHNGVAWADVRASNGVHGVWLSGGLRPDVTDEQVRVLRAGALSGDWRDRGGRLELIAALAVSVPGFPILREAVAASGLDLAESSLGWHVAGRQTALVASGVLRPAETALEALVAAGTVERCESCGKRLRTRHTATQTPIRADDRLSGIEKRLDSMVASLAILELRTRHARRETALAARDRLSSTLRTPAV